MHWRRVSVPIVASASACISISVPSAGKCSRRCACRALRAKAGASRYAADCFICCSRASSTILRQAMPSRWSFLSPFSQPSQTTWRRSFFWAVWDWLSTASFSAPNPELSSTALLRLRGVNSQLLPNRIGNARPVPTDSVTDCGSTTPSNRLREAHLVAN